MKHEHLWDTEPEDDVTYTPPAHYDQPWIIRMCCEGSCDAIKVTNRLAGHARTLIYDVVQELAPE